MRFSLTSLIRLIALLAMSLSAIAIGIARVTPRAIAVRLPAVPRFYGAKGATFSPPLVRDYVLDARTGALMDTKLSDTESFELAACSPWTDGDGQFELIGRRSDGSGGRIDSVRLASESLQATAIGLSPLASVQIEPVLSGRPCWLPRFPGRLVVPAGDGQLYVVQVGTEDAALSGTASVTDSDGEVREVLARPLRWACAPPGVGLPLIGDPIAPDFPALGGRVIVSLSTATDHEGQTTFGASQLWALEIDVERGLILDATRFETREDLSSPTPVTDLVDRGADARLANLASTPDGRLVVAYLNRRAGQGAWRLVVGDLIASGESTAPRFAIGKTAEVARDVIVSTPAISPDGRWVYAVSRTTQSSRPCVDRYPIGDVLKQARHRTATLWLPPGS